MTQGACSACGLPWRERSPGCLRHEIWEERAAVIEWDGKKTRDEAERLAVIEMAKAVRR